MSEITMPGINNDPAIKQDKKPEMSRADRTASFNLDDFSVPKGKEEEWRFTPIDRIKDLLVKQVNGKVDPPSVSGIESNRNEAGKKNLIEGEKLTWGTSGIIEYVEAGRKDTGTVGKPSDRVAAVAWQNATHITKVITGEREIHPVPLYIYQSAPAAVNEDRQPGASHLCIEAKEHSKATVVLNHTGSGALAQTVEIKVGTGADLTVVSVQEWDLDATHAANHRIEVGEAGHLKHVIVTLGGDLVRICTDATFGGAHADINLMGLYFTRNGQHQEHRIFVNHEVPDAKSRVTYKGALQGQKAHSVWVGDVNIGQKAFGTDTYELNRNLVLGKGPRADSVPNLEIQNGQIEGAGHASATGRFDDEQLFYLCSRGIDQEEAKRIVVRAFFAELLNEIELPELCEHIMEIVENELEQGGM